MGLEIILVLQIKGLVWPRIF